VRNHVRELNAGVTVQEELTAMKELGYECSEDELFNFINYPWSFDKIPDHDMFRDSLPAMWR
jgi:hypothetical protein